MKHTWILLLSAGMTCGAPGFISAQHLQSLSGINDCGLYGALSNPAHTSGSTNKLSINIFGAGAGVENTLFRTRFSYSLFGIATMQPKRDKQPELSEPFYLLQSRNQKQQTFNASAQILLPGICYQINPKISLYGYMRERAVGNLDKTSAVMANYLVYDEFTGDITNTLLSADVRVMAFHENALGIAGELYNRRESMIKGGITLKQISSAYTYIVNVSDVNSSISNDMLTFNAKYRIVKTNTDNLSTSPWQWISGANAAGKGFGADIGLVYEYRPYNMRHRYIVNNPKGKNPNFRQRDKLKYRYRLSWSVLDIGNIRYRNNISDKRYELSATMPAMYADSFKSPAYRSQIMESARVVSESNRLSMSLPTVMFTAADVRCSQFWFLNIAWQQNMKRRSQWGSVYSPTRLTCMIRKEGNKLTYGFPLTIVPATKTLTLGGMLKAGPVFLGTDNLQTLVSKQLYNCSAYAGILINIRYKSDPTIENFKHFRAF